MEFNSPNAVSPRTYAPAAPPQPQQWAPTCSSSPLVAGYPVVMGYAYQRPPHASSVMTHQQQTSPPPQLLAEVTQANRELKMVVQGYAAENARLREENEAMARQTNEALERQRQAEQALKNMEAAMRKEMFERALLKTEAEATASPAVSIPEVSVSSKSIETDLTYQQILEYEETIRSLEHQISKLTKADEEYKVLFGDLDGLFAKHNSEVRSRVKKFSDIQAAPQADEEGNGGTGDHNLSIGSNFSNDIGDSASAAERVTSNCVLVAPSDEDDDDDDGLPEPFIEALRQIPLQELEEWEKMDFVLRNPELPN